MASNQTKNLVFVTSPDNRGGQTADMGAVSWQSIFIQVMLKYKKNMQRAVQISKP